MPIDLIDRIYKIFEKDMVTFGHYYFEKHFRLRSPQFHLTIIKAILENDKVAIAAPRGSSKSTLILFLYLMWVITFKKRHFVLLVSNTFTKAADALETIKNEAKSNELFGKDFKVELLKDSYGDTIFRVKSVHFGKEDFDIRVLCKGSEQIGSARGIKFGAWRPDLILIDDLEDDEMVKNPERRRDIKTLFEEVLLGCGDRGTQVIAIGTVLHDDSLIADLVGTQYYKEWKKLRYKARWEYLGKLYSLWEAKWTVEELNAEERHNPIRFAKEKQNDPVSDLSSHFSKEDFRYWDIQNNNIILYNNLGTVVYSFELRDCTAAIACDLAWEDKRSADDTVIMPGLLTPNCDILIDYYFRKRGVRPNEIIENLFLMEEKYRRLTGTTVFIGFEKAKLEKIIKHLLEREMKVRNKWLCFKDLAWDTDKVERIVTRLQPRYCQHSIYHRRDMGDYENQLLRVPSGTHDDLPDCAQGLCQLLKNPKKVKKEAVEDTEFDWYRNLVVKKEPASYIFGRKRVKDVLNSQKSFR